MICKIACSVTKSNTARVILVDHDTNTVSIAGSSGASEDIFRRKDLSAFEKTAVERLTAAKKAFLINRKSTCPGEPFASVICAPAVFNGRFLAMLVLYSKARDSYINEDTKAAQALACQIALAIQNYNLYSNMHLNYFNTIKSLALAMEAKDPYTKGHSERVTEYALLIASHMGLSSQQVQMIKYCGVLHDLGKIAISDTILNKPGALTPQERKQIETHPAQGAEVLSPLVFLRSGIPLVRHHHERFDGKGYPDGLKEDKIPLTARILACADAYDAMTSDRPYRPKMTKEEAMRELKGNAGTQFDPHITAVFLDILKEGK